MKPLFVIFFMISSLCLSQQQEIDSLMILINQDSEDTDKVSILTQLAGHYLHKNTSYDSTISYARQAGTLAKKLNLQEAEAQNYTIIALASHANSHYDTALSHFKQALEIYQSLDNQDKSYEIIRNTGVTHNALGDYPKALESHEKAIDYYTSIPDKDRTPYLIKMLGNVYADIGDTYSDIGEYTRALDNYFKSLEIIEKVQDTKSMASAYLKIGTIKLELAEYEEAKAFYQKSLHINLSLKNNIETAKCYTRMGILLQKTDSLNKAIPHMKKAIQLYELADNTVAQEETLLEISNMYLMNNKPDTALQYINDAIVLQQKNNDQKRIALSYYNTAKAYRMKNKQSMALQAGIKSFDIAKELDLKKIVADVSLLLHMIYNDINDSRKSYQYLLLHKNYSDSLLHESKDKDIANIQSRYEISKIGHQNTLLQKENQLKEVQLEENETKHRTQQVILIFLIVGIAVTAVITYIIYKLYHSKKKANNLLEELNVEITEQKHEIEAQAEALVKANDKIRLINESLEERIQQHTKEIRLQNAKLKEYAFSNSHKVRAPIVRIIGLINLFSNDTIEPSEASQIHQLIVEETHNLDNITDALSKVIDEEKMSKL